MSVMHTQKTETGTKNECRSVERALRASYKAEVKDNAERYNMSNMEAADILRQHVLVPPTPGEASGSRDYDNDFFGV